MPYLQGGVSVEGENMRIKQQENCAVAWCKRRAFSKNVCQKHWTHFKVYRRTIDRNEYFDTANGIEILLLGRNGRICGRALIDKEDFKLVYKRKWFKSSNGYPKSWLDRKRGDLFLHRLFLGDRDGFDIDHINRDKLDNRRKNLRHLTHARNSLNRGDAKGIFYLKRREAWIASIEIDKKRIVKEFKTKKEAVIHRKLLEDTYAHGIIYKEIAP